MSFSRVLKASTINFYHVCFKNKEMRLVAKLSVNNNTVSVLSSVTGKTGLSSEQHVIAVLLYCEYNLAK